MKLLALAIIVLTCALLSLTEARLLIQPRCRCTETVQTYIPDDRIVKMEKFQPGPHCKNVEIIATVKYRKETTLCLNPNVKWVQDALKRRNLA
ncbi:interleukin-8-like [Silurus meridionalis]|uniref:interleukin-8-like n=1 Tax=Silurus meridionalis TaxID=175797 RepID=UPI001EEAEFAD|nr:interleukin-8-like [Silurus meridionalis]